MSGGTLLGAAYVALTLIFTVYGQLVLKWRISLKGPAPSGAWNTIVFLLGTLTDVWVVSCYAAAFLASLCWMAALTRFELSTAYPFMSLAFVLVMALGVVAFGEALTAPKVIGTVFVVAGLYLCSR